MPSQRKYRSRLKHDDLVDPNPVPDSLVDREAWIESASKGFISRGASNRRIYRIILETLWPEGHGIPGPHVTEEAIRAAVDAGLGKTYHDPFRRMRELQGDEGFLGIIKSGKSYQLQSLNIGAKKQPRTSISDDAWQRILQKYNNKCAVCGCSPDENGFQQDHKIPRDRGGNDTADNYQPLCDNCNITKSTICRGCSGDCYICPWAYPERYRPIRLAASTVKEINDFAKSRNIDPNDFVTNVVLEYISRESF